MKKLFCTLALIFMLNSPAQADVITPYIGIFGTTSYAKSPGILFTPILAATALPLYQDYVAKAQVNRVYLEMSVAKVIIDAALPDGKKITLDAENKDGYESLGLVTENGEPRNPLISKYELKGFENNEEGKIVATFGGRSDRRLHDSKIHLERKKDGAWICSIERKNPRFKQRFYPVGCALER